LSTGGLPLQIVDSEGLLPVLLQELSAARHVPKALCLLNYIPETAVALAIKSIDKTIAIVGVRADRVARQADLSLHDVSFHRA